MRGERLELKIWIPTLYFAKGIPHVVVFVITLLLLHQMHLSPSETLCCVSLCYMPWVLKVWWKPYIDSTMDCKRWILLTQLLLMFTFALLAFVLSTQWLTVCLLFFMAWLAAIHNVATDGLTHTSPSSLAPHTSHLTPRVCLLPSSSIFEELPRKFALVVGQGVLLVLAGNIQVFYRHDMLYAWRVLFYILSGIFMLLFFWHVFSLPTSRRKASSVLPRTSYLVPCTSYLVPCTSYLAPCTSYLAPRTSCISFLLFYPFAQGMVAKVSILFLVNTFRNGGVGLSPQEFGFVMGIIGIAALTAGGFLGMKALSRYGFSRCLRPMALSMLIPCAVYVALSYWQPQSLMTVGLCVLVEQFAYGFGFAAYLSYLKQIEHREQGKSLMALSLMMGCLISGPLLQSLGYNGFFILTQVLSLLTLLSTIILKRKCQNALRV